MSDDEIIALRRQIQALATAIPESGGCVRLRQSIFKSGMVDLCGDRAGLIRLGWTILNFALTAKPLSDPLKAEGRYLKDFFDDPSDFTQLRIDLNEQTKQLIEEEQTLFKERNRGFFERLAKRISGLGKRKRID